MDGTDCHKQWKEIKRIEQNIRKNSPEFTKTPGSLYFSPFVDFPSKTFCAFLHAKLTCLTAENISTLLSCLWVDLKPTQVLLHEVVQTTSL